MDAEKKDQKETPMDEIGAASSPEAAASTSEAAASTSEGTGSSSEAAASTSTGEPKRPWTMIDTHNAINEFVHRVDLFMRYKLPHFPYQLPENMDELEKRTEDDQEKK